MKIVITTPLFPPEIGEPATYVKDLAGRLSANHHVVIVAYANHAERTKNTSMSVIPKDLFLPLRFTKFFVHLFKAADGADVIYAHGIATGLQSIVVGKLKKIPVVYRLINDEPWARAFQLGLTKEDEVSFMHESAHDLRTKIFRFFQQLILRNAQCIVVPSFAYPPLFSRAYDVPLRKFRHLYNPEGSEMVLPFDMTTIPFQTYLETENQYLINRTIQEVEHEYKQNKATRLVLVTQAKVSLTPFIIHYPRVSTAERYYLKHISTPIHNPSVKETRPWEVHLKELLDICTPHHA